MRINGHWRQFSTTRGGYQGLRLVTILFCCFLRRSFRSAVTTETVQKPKYQDDNYFVGKLTEMASFWGPLLAQMSSDGHVINLRKSELWIPGGETVRPAHLTQD
eukprot:12411136-Karenia_brevis.AAC.1